MNVPTNRLWKISIVVTVELDDTEDGIVPMPKTYCRTVMAEGSETWAGNVGWVLARDASKKERLIQPTQPAEGV